MVVVGYWPASRRKDNPKLKIPSLKRKCDSVAIAETNDDEDGSIVESLDDGVTKSLDLSEGEDDEGMFFCFVFHSTSILTSG